MSHEGGCFCGKVRYRAEAEPDHVAHCHCTMCRLASGAPFVTWATFPAPAFAWTKGAPRIIASSAIAERGFCADCGASLSFRYSDRDDEIDIAAATLDRPEAVTPTHHIWTRSRLEWIRLDDGLPQYDENVPEG